jgi:hypothetical protein
MALLFIGGGMSAFENKKLRKNLLQNKKQRKKTIQSGLQPAVKNSVASPNASSSSEILQYQYTAGNRAVAEWLQPEENLIPSSEVLNKRGAGRELPSPLRHEMEQHLRMDLSGVRLHTDEAANRLNRQFHASAFAVGKDIFFRQGIYNPHSENGIKILKHELAHVAQQGGRSAAQLHLGKAGDRHEQEAERFSNNPHSTSISPVSRAGVIQRGLFDRLTDVKDQPVLTPLGGGTANKVYKVAHSNGLPGGYFKPTKKEDPQMASRAVVSSAVDRMLGTNALSREAHVKYNGQKGGESTEVAGRSVSENEFNTQLPPEMAQELDDETIESMPQIYKRNAAGTFKTSGTRFMRHDFSHPETQRSMSNLQLQDAITGQLDRHGGNIKIDENHTARGFDNDMVSLDPHTDDGNIDRTGLHDKKPGHQDARKAARIRMLQAVNKQGGKQVGLPSHIDQATAQSVLGLKSKEMIAQLKRNKAQGNLSDEQMALLKDRYSATRRYVKAGMAAAGQVRDPAKLTKWSSPQYQAMVRAGTGKIPTIVGQGGWGQGTFNAQMNEQAQTEGEYSSYLKRSSENLTEAALNRTQTGNYAEPGNFTAAHHTPGGGAPRMVMGQHVAPPTPVIPPKPTIAPPIPAQLQTTASTSALIPSGNTHKLIERFGGGV